MTKIRIVGTLAGLAFFGIVNSVQATPIEIGSFTFDENASADAVGNTTGTDIRTFRINADGSFDINTFSLDLVLTDSDVNTGAFCQAPCTIELLFTDNAVVNGAGADLILFEQGAAESTDVTINGTTLTFASFVTEDAIRDAQDGLISIFGIELDSFGVASGDTIISVLLDLNFDQDSSNPAFPSSDPVGLFALHSVTISIDPSVTLGDGSAVGAGSVLKKDITIGFDANIGDNVTLSKDIDAGDDFEVGDETIVNQGVNFGDDVVVGQYVTIGRLCVIDNGVNIGDNTTIGQLCNIGDYVIIGSNVVIGQDVTVSSSHFIPNDSVIPAHSTIP